MIPCKRAPQSLEKRRSKAIENELKDDHREARQFNNLLLLGTGESGKTTIIKQMQILHINGFSEDDKKKKIPSIKQNLHESIYSIVSSMGKIHPPLSIRNGEVKLSEEFILNIGPDEPNEYNDEYFKHVKILWADSDVQEAYSRSNEYQLIDSAQHFLDQVDTIKQPDYIPSIQDILYCRVETKAISEIRFSVKVPLEYYGGVAKFCMFDVGGQRGHRRKWISVFDGIQAIVFLIAASDFDQTLREDETKNRLEESFQIFSDIFWSRYVRDAGKVVFLNKQDLLKKKIENGKQIAQYFPEYAGYSLPRDHSGPRNEYERAKYFMKQIVIDISKQKPDSGMEMVTPDFFVPKKIEDRHVYIHFTIATDTNNIKLVFDDVRDLILSINIQKISGE